MDPIKIILSVDAQRAAESVQSFVDATTQAIEKSYTQAVDKAQAKLDELNRKQQVHKEVIEANGRAITELQTKRDTASAAEQKNLDQEIKRLQQLTNQRQLDLVKIDEQKAKVEEKGLLALGATEAERKALQGVTDQRLIDLGAVRNAIQAQNSVKDAADAAHRSAADGLDKVAEKRAVIGKVIEAEQTKLEELRQQKENASAAESKKIDLAIEQQQRLIAVRKDELLALDSKRIKLEEEQQIANATNQSEEAEIRSVTAAKLAQIEVDRDAIRAQKGMKDALDDSNSSMMNIVAGAGKLIGITSAAAAITVAFQAANQSIEKMRQELQASMQAAEQIRTKQLDTFSQTQGAFAELGITDPTGKQAALAALRGTIPEQQGLTPDVVVRTAQGMGSALRGIDPSSARFADIVGNASQAVYQGMDPSLIKNVYNDMARDNPNVTGGQLNQRLADLNAAAGSPSQANELMGIAQEQRSRYGMLGLGSTDIEKMFVSAGRNGIAPEERGSAIGGLLRGLDRFVGKTPEQYLSLYEEMTGVRKVAGQGEFLSTMSKFMTPEQMLDKEMHMQKLQNFGELDDLFKGGVSGKQINMAGLAARMGGMSKDRLEQVITAGGGPRATASSLAVGDWNSVQLKSGGMFQAPATAQEQAASRSAVADFKANNVHPVDADAATMQAQIDAELKLLQQHPEWLPEITRNYNESNWFTGAVRKVGHAVGGIPSTEEVAASNVLARMFIKDAALQRDVQAGKVKMTDDQWQALTARVRAEGGSLRFATKGGAIGEAVKGASYNLPDPNDDAAVRKWMSENVNYQRNTASPMDEIFSGMSNMPGAGGYVPPNPQRIDPNKPLPPAPKMGPQSINYNIRMNNYGYTNDALSAVMQPHNNFG